MAERVGTATPQPLYLPFGHCAAGLVVKTRKFQERARVGSRDAWPRRGHGSEARPPTRPLDASRFATVVTSGGGLLVVKRLSYSAAGAGAGAGRGPSSRHFGRALGEAAIPGSDGQCGPDGGPQCAGCRRRESDAFAADPAYAALVADDSPFAVGVQTLSGSKLEFSVRVGHRAGALRGA